MNEFEAFYARLLSTGYPVAFEHFIVEEGDEVQPSDAPTMPFICYTEISPNNFGADNKVFYSGRVIETQLFTEKKNIQAEAKLEQALEGLYWTKEAEYLEDELCYRVIYRTEI